MIKVKTKTGFKKATKYLVRLSNNVIPMETLKKYGDMGVEALKASTPVDSGKTRDSWYYEIKQYEGRVDIRFCNSNVNDGVEIAVILQYGHATGTGGWVEGIDYINPAMKPVFQNMKDEIWREVTK